jgi:N-methylhydantoinase A/oxoprolinase/acetone carboxylase beta subunit
MPGDQIQGPTIFEERESTTIISPGEIATVDTHYNLIISIENVKGNYERFVIKSKRS